jgi:hypothetical protein
MSVLENLLKSNEYPIIFIGSGISKRYLNNFPGWEELLESYWIQMGKTLNFYSYLSTISNEIREQYPDISENRLNYLTNIRAAQTIETDFNQLYFQEKITVPNLNVKEAYQQKLSPFKKSISEKFSNYDLVAGITDEIELFKVLIRKAQIIVTTNYDTFIEDMYSDDHNGRLTTYVGHKGFFDQSEGWAELFKIHGSIVEPNSIVITEGDYALYDKNAILISAKLIAALVNSPIIFLGYSLTDINVQNLISDFASQLPNEDSRKSAQRIIVIERVEGLEKIEEEQVSDYNLGWHYTLIRTDNFKLLFEQLMKINQGLSPYHVRKYHQVIKKLVVARGKAGALDAVLLSPQELADIEGKIDAGKPIVLALGDKAHIYRMPNIISYMNDYIFEKEEIMTDVALRFIANEPANSRVPFAKYIKGVDLNKIDITPEEREKVRQKISRHGNLSRIVNSINRYYQITYNKMDDVIKEGFNKAKEVDIVVFNINNIDMQELQVYTLSTIHDFFPTSSGSLKTSLRRLATAYDLKMHGDLFEQ